MNPGSLTDLRSGVSSNTIMISVLAKPYGYKRYAVGCSLCPSRFDHNQTVTCDYCFTTLTVRLKIT